jgi:Ran GTPase-activating protein (RanGAP) involved in mRNA processing and transport
VGVDGEDCSVLAQSLSQNSTLKKLSLAYNGLSDTAGCMLFSSLKRNTGLTDLNIAGNFLSTDSCQALADLLEDPSSLSRLTNLNLAQNILIRDDGAAIIATALAVDKRVRHLNLSEMRLSKTTSTLLETTLASNHTLQRLNFAKNSLGESGAVDMANLLRVNTTLLHLNLSDTKIGPKGSEALSKALTDENDTLVSLNLGGNSMILYPTYLEAMIMSNCTLQHLWLPSHLLENDSPIPTFLKLNKFGRTRMLQERNNSFLWKSALVEFASDLHASYYLLRMNPAIISWM